MEGNSYFYKYWIIYRYVWDSRFIAEFGNVVFTTCCSCDNFPTVSSERVKQFNFTSECAYTFKLCMYVRIRAYVAYICGV